MYKPQSLQSYEAKHMCLKKVGDAGSPGLAVIRISLEVSISVVRPLTSLCFVVPGF